MKKNHFTLTIFTIFILLIVIISGLRLIQRQSEEYDEWGYVNTFKNITKGSPLYTKTFFSQLPGFVTLIYPGFKLFGETLQSARFTIFLWAFLGLITILWFSNSYSDVWIGVLTIGLLYGMPSYYKQILTFQADSLPSIFSLLSITMMFRYRSNKKDWQFIASMIFLTIAIYIKFDISALPALILAAVSRLKRPSPLIILKYVAFIIFPLVIVLTITIANNNIIAIGNNVFNFRKQAYIYSSPHPLRFFSYVLNDPFLLVVLIGDIILSTRLFIEKKLTHLILCLILWIVTTLLSEVFYKPLMPQHIFYITIPSSLLFANLVFSYIKNDKIFKISTVLLVTLTVAHLFWYSFNVSYELIPNISQNAIKIILNYTKKTDYVLTDNFSLVVLSKRNSIPELSDVSSVRVESGNLTPTLIERYINIYKPKLIILWEERLNKVNDLDLILKKYILLFRFDSKHIIYFRKGNAS